MTFRQFPPRQATASFTIDTMMKSMQQMLQMRATALGEGAAPGTLSTK
jgi:arylsulfatase